MATKSQATQTLPVQTEPATQLMSHEVHQFTQLVNNESVEHVPGDTLVNDSDLEGSGHTVVLPDDGADHDAHGDAQSALCRKNKNGASSQDHGDGEGGNVNTSWVGAQEPKEFKQTVLPDSAATTEEGDADEFDYNDDGESHPDEGMKADIRPSLSGIRDVGVATKNMLTPVSASVALVSGKQSLTLSASASRPRSIASVRAASLHARATSKSVSTAKEVNQFDSEATVELADESEKPLQRLDNQHECKTGGSVSIQISPKVTLPFDRGSVHSPRMSTSRSRSTNVFSDHLLLGDAIGAPLEHNNTTTEGFSEVPERFKISNGQFESILALNEQSNPGLSRMQSQGSFVLVKKDKPTIVLKEVEANQGAPRSDGVMNGNVQSRQSSGNKGRKLVFECNEATSTLELECRITDPTRNSAEPEQASASCKLVSGVLRGRQHSLPHSASNHLSYIESQEPGEESQMNALNIVDKLAWLEGTCMYDDTGTGMLPEDAITKGQTGAKGLKSLAKAAHMKIQHDKLDVFDWEDSQVDEAISPCTKQAPDKFRVLKRNLGASNLMIGRKKQVMSLEKKAELASDWEQKAEKDPKTSLQGRTAVLDVETSTGDPEFKPNTNLATRLRNRTKAEFVPSKKERKRPHINMEPRKRGTRKKPSDETCKKSVALMDTKQQQQDHVSKVQQAEQVEKKGKQELTTTFENVSRFPDGRGSMDDAAADIWIEAFASNKIKPPSTGLIKFKKRRALLDDTTQESKKQKTVQGATVCSEDSHDTSRTKKMSEHDSHAHAATSQPRDRGVTTRSTRSNQGVRHQGTLTETHLLSGRSKAKKYLKNSMVVGAAMLSPRKPRRFGTHGIQVEHQSIPPKKQDVREEFLERLDSKKPNTTDLSAFPQNEGWKMSTHSSQVQDQDGSVQAEDAMDERDVPERGCKTRSVYLRSTPVTAVNTDGENAIVTRQTIDNASPLSTSAVHDDLDAAKASNKVGIVLKKRSKAGGKRSKAGGSKLMESTATHGQGAGLDAQKAEPDEGMTPIHGEERAPPGRLKRSKRRGEAVDAGLSESAKAHPGKGPLSAPAKELGTGKSLPKHEDVPTTGTLRRTRSGACEGLSLKEDTAGAQQLVGDKSGAVGVYDKLQYKLWVARTAKSLPKRYKKTAALNAPEKSKNSEEGRRPKREPGAIRVLFSHSLTEDMVKHQKKILGKLGGQVATSASDCTHFVSNFFVRTRNMLLSMAAGKVIATPQWLESCYQARYFVDEKSFVLQDEKKEKEFGFSMVSSLVAARRKPLLKGIQVVVSSNTVPEPALMKAIVESAGGQVLDLKSYSQLNEKQDDTHLMIVANEKDYAFCLQFLNKGLKVYSEELLLNGIVTQSLDLSRNRLFEDFRWKKSGRRGASTKA